MATLNGWTDHDGQDTISTNHLGKRKRSDSPTKPMTNGVPDFADILQLLRKHDTSPSILVFPLSTRISDEPRTKRSRLNHDEQETETIESRLAAGTYTSVKEIVEEIISSQKTILSTLTTSAPDSSTRSSNAAAEVFSQQVAKMVEVLSNLTRHPHSGQRGTVEESGSTDSKPEDTTAEGLSEILTLRSQTERGPQQLFSGLCVDENAADSNNGTAIKNLPNGFDMTQPLATHTGVMIPANDTRSFGEVFRPHRNTKPLEAPYTAKQASRSRKLEFTQDLGLNQVTPVYKHDYNFTSLATGSWLQYGENRQSKARTMSGNLRDTPAAPGDFEAALLANQVLAKNEENTDSLFKMVYSSFAPSRDNSEAIISDYNRSRQWWNKYGDRNMQAIFSGDSVNEDLNTEAVLEVDQDEFADLVANFDSVDEPTTDEQPEQDLDDILEEVSNLIQTLHSYQKINSLRTTPEAIGTKPDSTEQQVYEMLRSQLIILVDSLPPYAIAKLDGDILNELNVSTNIMIQRPEFRGTGQIDEFTLRKTRLAQAATTTGARNAVPGTQRAPYQTPAPSQAANSQARAYNSNVIANSYTPRTAYVPPSTNTVPRPIQGRPPYQQTTPSYSAQPTHEQYQQRPVQNGYGSHASTPAPQSYSQRPSQPGYQQRAQASAAATTFSQNPMAGFYQHTNSVRKPGYYNPAPKQVGPDQKSVTGRVNGQQAQSQSPGIAGQPATMPYTQSATPNANNTPSAVGQIQPRPRAVVGQ